MKFRNLMRKLHGSIGLMMGLLFAIVSLTGSGIVFHTEIDRSLNQSLHIVGIALFGMSISGLILWTGWRKLKSGLKIRWNAPKTLLNFDLHQSVGMISQLLLVVLSLTGTMIIGLHLAPMFGSEQTAAIPAPTGQPIGLSQCSY